VLGAIRQGMMGNIIEVIKVTVELIIE